jgi:2-polyprenyl-6-methoxyphenol hydroxylase-like FAD-dependent oxidoreductase
MSNDRTEVLIAGAGPTGLVLALWLAREGVAVRIVERTEEPGDGSRAMAVQARTLEFYRQLGFADEVVDAGLRNPAINMWSRGKHRARLDLGDAGKSLSHFPYVLIYPQDHHERLLTRHLEDAGVRVEHCTELLGFDATADRVLARLRGLDGAERTCTAAWLAGCDGAHSTVRQLLGTGFEGGTYSQTFYVADVEVDGAAANGEIHASFEHSDFVLLMSYTRTGMARLIGAIRPDPAAPPEHELAFEDVRQYALASMGLSIRRVNWFSTYRVHHRVTGHYRQGRVLLAGDAAHVHSPAGGQGMNTGIGDAVNLGWKLAAVCAGRAPATLLDSYESERIAFAHKLVETTDRIFSLVTAEGGFADFARTRIAPVFASIAYGIEPLRESMFRTLSQIAIHYPGSPLSAAGLGKVHGGDRMPWTGFNGPDNHEALPAPGWQVQVHGEPTAGVTAWCGETGVALRRFAWSEGAEEAGLEPDAVYLVRPDGHVALVDADGEAGTLRRYFTEREMRPV